MATVHQPDPRDHAGCRRFAAVQAVGGQRCHLDEGAPLVEQARDTVPRQQLAASDVAFP